MKIDRKKLVKRHNPVLRAVEISSPLSVGNGEFCFTADPTGLQTLYDTYDRAKVPLCTMAQWGWHTTPSGAVPEYTDQDLNMTEYSFNGRKVTYPVEKKAGNEKVYDWLRQNPHRLNLARIGFRLSGNSIQPEQLSNMKQELDLYDGMIFSSFYLQQEYCCVKTACSPFSNTLSVDAASNLFTNENLSVALNFPYGDPGISGSNWSLPNRHSTNIMKKSENSLLIQRKLDDTVYYVFISAQSPVRFQQTDAHCICLTSAKGCDSLKFTVQFSNQETFSACDTDTVIQQCQGWWNKFWEDGGAISFSGSEDPRAEELERRIILSQYLLAVNCCGSMPPQETGLYCNSWYGKFHLEMTLWHWAGFSLWNHSELLMRGLPWYKKSLDAARKNAARNRYSGARWPKMVAGNAIDSPSPIAPLLIWQEPHIIFLLELLFRNNQKREFLEEYWDIVKETADFMAGFAVFDSKTQEYDLLPPLIPAQEEYKPQTVKNPAFETEYWVFALEIAILWAKRLGYSVPHNWTSVMEKMAPVPQSEGLYIAHAFCPDTFEHFNRDHPSMLAACGLLPGKRIDRGIMHQTLCKAVDCWDYSTLWGWDFAMMAMTAARLGEPEKAVDLLLCNTPKNQYEKNGHNFQLLRDDLPAYLPGNGGLLLAVALMTAGFDGCREQMPGFPKNGKWKIDFENISPLL